MSIVRIALDLPLSTLFDYALADGVTVAPGQRVLVPFGRKQIVGVVMECVTSSELDCKRIKQVGAKDKVRIPPGTETIDCSRYTVMPGMMDLHIHTAMFNCMTFHNHRVAQFEIMPHLQQMYALFHAQNCFDMGFTTLRDLGMNGPYGLIKQRHMFQYGTKQEQFAKCAVDQRFNALLNENAMWQGQPITIEDVLNSRYTNAPLHLLESVMPCSGTNAVVVTSAERARGLPNPPVYILGVGGPATRHDDIWQEEETATSPVVLSAPTAFQMSGYNVKDIQFAEFYDCYTILAMMCLEDAGICRKGEIGPFYESTDTTYKGTFPINTDGGQISGGQPGGAGGFRHVVEATRQVMGRAGQRQVAKNDLCLVNG